MVAAGAGVTGAAAPVAEGTPWAGSDAAGDPDCAVPAACAAVGSVWSDADAAAAGSAALEAAAADAGSGAAGVVTLSPLERSSHQAASAAATTTMTAMAIRTPRFVPPVVATADAEAAPDGPCLGRSSMRGGGGGGGGGGTAPASAVSFTPASEFPQLAQKRTPMRLRCPQPGQAMPPMTVLGSSASACRSQPQARQNLEPSRFSAPHFGHRMATASSPLGVVLGRSGLAGDDPTGCRRLIARLRHVG